MSLRTATATALFFSIVAGGCALAASPRPLELKRVSLDLPGPPSAVISADLNGDKVNDLLVVIAYTEWGSVSEDRIEALVQIVDVVPALFDHREARAWLGDGHGGYVAVPKAFPLPTSVLSLEAGPSAAPIVALTDDGVAILRVTRDGGEPVLVLEPRISDPPVLAGTGTFVPDLGLTHDLDGDGELDLLLPAADGVAVYLWGSHGFGTTAAQRIPLPGDRRMTGRSPSRSYPLADVRDLDRDHKVDLVVRERGSAGDAFYLLRGEGQGRFGKPQRMSKNCLLRAASGAATKPAERVEPSKKKKKKEETHSENVGAASELIFLGDLDSDGTVEAVAQTESDEGDGLKEAKEPHFSLSFFRASSGLVFPAQPYAKFNVVGYAFGGSWPDVSEDGLRDLDGDGRLDLVTVTLDFSIFQVLRVLATKKVSIGVDFHIWSQGPDGRFTQVEGLDLSETLRLDLNDVKLSRFAEFGGDFDGDGRIDFVHLGRGKEVTIHRGTPGCRYAKKPDLVVELAEEPQDLALVRVTDLDGDGRADLAVTRPLTNDDEGASAPVRLDLYLSGGAR